MLIDELGGVTSELVSFSLDAAMKKQEVIANNVANATTPGYSVKQYNFEKILTQYVEASSGKVDAQQVQKDLPRLREQLFSGDAIETLEGEQVKLDEQMVSMTKNVLFYKALLEASAKNGSIIKLAVNGGRGQ